MSETNNHTPIDQDPSVRAHLDLDHAEPAVNPVLKLAEFSRGLDIATGRGNSDRVDWGTADRHSNGRPNRARVFAAGLATGAVLATAAANGMFDERGDEQKLVDGDKQNQEANIENNPELYNGELPANPSDLTVEVKP